MKGDTAVCVQCHSQFVQVRSDQKYCSRKCISRAHRLRHGMVPEHICPVCNKPFKRDGVLVTYCSVSCRDVARGYNQPRVCDICGASFIPGIERKKRYCSPACGDEADRRQKHAKCSGVGKGGATRGKSLVPRQVCEQCGDEFYAPPALMRRGGGRFCCVACRMIWEAKNKPPSRNRRSLAGKREDLDNQYFRSSWEANWARYLNWLLQVGEILKWEYEVDEFEFERVRRGQRFYLPDFKVTNKDGSVEYHEIKGYMDARSKTKLARMEKYYPQVVVKLIDKDAYKSIAREFKTRLPGWETVGAKKS